MSLNNKSSQRLRRDFVIMTMMSNQTPEPQRQSASALDTVVMGKQFNLLQINY
jgi:hypothetical protein